MVCQYLFDHLAPSGSAGVSNRRYFKSLRHVDAVLGHVIPECVSVAEEVTADLTDVTSGGQLCFSVNLPEKIVSRSTAGR